jgi:large subunit ribosomal protein L22
MPQYKYAFQAFNEELMARAIGRDAAISSKQSIEISNYLRHRKLVQAKRLLEEVIEKKRPIPFRRFTNALGHKPGKLTSGRYPIKASRVFLKLLEAVEANAQTKGLNSNELEIIHICAHKAHNPVHYGRHHGREFKRTHIEVVVQETTKKKEKKEKKEEKTEKKPAVQKKTEKKEEKEAKEVKEEKAQAAHEKKEEKKEKKNVESNKGESNENQQEVAK